VNDAPLYSGHRVLPRIHANQVVQDLSVDELKATLSTGQLEASHETNLGGGFFGLSYRHSLRNVKTSSGLEALVFQIDIVELYSDLTEPALQYKLWDPNQQMLEVLLIQKPILSASEPSPVFEILNVKFVPRSLTATSRRTMHYLAWDDHGKIGTPSHYFSSIITAFTSFLTSGFWALFGFIMAVIIVFIVVVLMCVFGWEFWRDDYEKAQQRKHRRVSSVKGRGDVESGVQGRMKGRFKSAEELGLGLAGRGQVVGMGKSD
jgi:hypothetical protein